VLLVEELDLSHNQIDDDAVVVLCAALPHLQVCVCQ